MEQEQLKTALHRSNYDDQFPDLPPGVIAQYHESQAQDHESQVARKAENQHVQPPQQKSNYQQKSRPSQQAQSRESQVAKISQKAADQPSQRQSIANLDQNDISFLAKTIKDAIKEDLAEELAKIKENLSIQIQNSSRPQIIQAKNLPQGQAQPVFYTLSQQGM